MITGKRPGASVRAVHEFGLALRDGAFRVALVLSVLVHLGLLLALRLREAEPGARENVPLMRVRLLARLPAPAAAPAAAPVTPAVRPPAPEKAADSEAVIGGTESRPAVREEVQPQPHAASESSLPPRPTAPDNPAQGQAPEQAPGESPFPAEAHVPERPDGSTGTKAPTTTGGGAALEGRMGRSLEGAGTPAVEPVSAEPEPLDLSAVRRRIDSRKVYPRIAVRNGWEGRVLVEMRLEGDGRLAGVRLLEGSGHAVLDEATIAAVRLAAPFPSVARVLTVPVEYRLAP